MSERRVVVTGIGLVSPLGCEVDTVWQRLTAGQSGIVSIDRFDASEYAAQIAGQLKDFTIDDHIPRKEQRRNDAYSNYAIVAARSAHQDSGLEVSDPTRVGAVIGSGIGGLGSLEEQMTVLAAKGPSRLSPFLIPQMIGNMAAGLVAIDLGLQGPNYAVVSACATAAHSIGDAMRSIQRGEADVMFTGGSEAAITPIGIGGFCALKALCTRNDEPTRASRPFDAERSGFVMGEGAAIIVIEELEHAKARGAKIYCELGGFGQTCDANHITAPAEGGAGAARAMTMSMEEAGISGDQVDYVNAHGTSTQLNDKSETQAIKTALGEENAYKAMVSSTKSMTGHLLGAAGSLEAAFCALAIDRGVVPPTINQENPDPDCDLDYVPNESREADVNVCISNSLGFGGQNASLLMKKLA